MFFILLFDEVNITFENFSFHTNDHFSFDFHSNWIGVGIFNEGDTQGHYQKMYYENEASFKRKDFYHETNPVQYDDGQFTVRGTCGTSHGAEIKIDFVPNSKDEFAPSIKKLLEPSS